MIRPDHRLASPGVLLTVRIIDGCRALILVDCHRNHKINPPCVVDPALNEPTCNHEARMAVAKRHGFEDMAHANMSEAIQGSERLQREFDKVHKACMAKHRYCEYRE
jgi:hypothetical protein